MPQVSDWFINMRKRHWKPIVEGEKEPGGTKAFLEFVLDARVHIEGGVSIKEEEKDKRLKTETGATRTSTRTRKQPEESYEQVGEA